MWHTKEKTMATFRQRNNKWHVQVRRKDCLLLSFYHTTLCPYCARLNDGSIYRMIIFLPPYFIESYLTSISLSTAR